MADKKLGDRLLSTRPDRIDFRDRMFMPRLQSLPPLHPPIQHVVNFLDRYHHDKKILDQGKEGACTGYGLAAVINYIIWEQWLERHKWEPPREAKAPPNVSPLMLYDLARMYDEWEGEEYSGSSCRGAMKGWHKHGICGQNLWHRDKLEKAGEQRKLDWSRDALSRPLGAYYRVEARSIPDMQAAIHEVRAVYCSARVHDGWLPDAKYDAAKFDNHVLPVIRPHKTPSGGHAFAIVGYTPQGFIIQNSWGPKWGYGGFAILTYQDWVQNSNDAWVSSMAAPVSDDGNITSPVAAAPEPLAETTLNRLRIATTRERDDREVWSTDEAYLRSVILGNDGKILRRIVDVENAEAALRKVVLEESRKAIASGVRNILVFAHGGLNSEEGALTRARIMGPWFAKNKIHPIFINWRTSVQETIGSIGEDFVGDFLKQREKLSEGIASDLLKNARDKLQNQFDKAFEAAAEKLIGKAMWNQMKQNAGAAANGKGGTRQVLQHLRTLKAETPDLKIHLLGHSAGSILLGHMASDLRPGEAIDTVSLYAPACTTKFAISTYGRLLEKSILGPNKLYIDNLSHDREEDDTVGPYGRSLLCLVSRALEETRNVPLLGLQRAWLLGKHAKTLVPPEIFTNADNQQELKTLRDDLKVYFDPSQLKHIEKWAMLANQYNVQFTFHDSEESLMTDPKVTTKRTHGSFDNDINIVNASIWRILGREPDTRVTDLSGF